MEPRAHCVTYADKFSVGGSAQTDLLIGHRDRIVACNSKRIDKARAGDIVLVMAGKPENRLIMIGRLTRRADERRDTWLHEGGTCWSYCWEFETLLPPTKVTPFITLEIKRLAEGTDVNPRYIMNSRLCPHRATPILTGLSTALASVIHLWN